MGRNEKTGRGPSDGARLGSTWSAGSNGHVGTLEVELPGVRLGLEIYRTANGELLWRWRDGVARRAGRQSAAIEGDN